MESPGTAPGSEPLITQGFITIVPKNGFKIRGLTANEKTGGEKFPAGLSCFGLFASLAAYWLRRRSEISAAIVA